MSRDDALTILREHLPELRARFGVASIALFGSTARDEARLTSDVDVLVSFAPEASAGLFTLVRLKRYLEAVLACEVDVLTPGGLHPRLRGRIYQDLAYA